MNSIASLPDAGTAAASIAAAHKRKLDESVTKYGRDIAERMATAMAAGATSIKWVIPDDVLHEAVTAVTKELAAKGYRAERTSGPNGFGDIRRYLLTISWS